MHSNGPTDDLSRHSIFHILPGSGCSFFFLMVSNVWYNILLSIVSSRRYPLFSVISKVIFKNCMSLYLTIDVKNCANYLGVFIVKKKKKVKQTIMTGFRIRMNH